MNRKRGFRRITWVSSIVGGLLTAFYICSAFNVDFTEAVERAYGETFLVMVGLPIFLLLGFAPTFLAIWIAYWIVCWIVKGFADGKPKGKEKEGEKQ